MPDLAETSEQTQAVSTSESSEMSGASSGILPNRNTILFWFAASGVVWIALAISAIWLI